MFTRSLHDRFRKKLKDSAYTVNDGYSHVLRSPYTYIFIFNRSNKDLNLLQRET